MGFQAAKKAVLECLAEGLVLHEARGAIEEKNLLATGELSVDVVRAFIGKCRGDQYECQKHHYLKNIDVHIFKPLIKAGTGKFERWYIKCYFIEPNAWFISVHKSKQ